MSFFFCQYISYVHQILRDLRKAKKYGNVVLKLEVSLGNVKAINASNFDSDRLSWRSQGYDCAFVPANAGIR